MTVDIGKYRPLMDAAIIDSGKTQGQIATEVGFPNVNTLSIIKAGKTHLSFDRVLPFAYATGINGHKFMMMVLEEREPAIFNHFATSEEKMVKKFEADLDALRKENELLKKSKEELTAEIERLKSTL